MNRYNIFTFIHKGLRQSLLQGLLGLGQVDETNPLAVCQCLTTTEQLLHTLLRHQHYAESLIHPLLQSSETLQQTHRQQQQWLWQLDLQIQHISTLPAVITATVLHQLYQDFALFCAAQLQHLAQEQAQLTEWLQHNEPEQALPLLHQQLMQTLSAAEYSQCIQLIVPALTTTERLTLLLDLQQKLSARCFQQLFCDLQQSLTSVQALSLHKHLGLPACALQAL